MLHHSAIGSYSSGADKKSAKFQKFEILQLIKAFDFPLCLTKVQYYHNNTIVVIQVVYLMFYYKAAFSRGKIYVAARFCTNPYF